MGMAAGELFAVSGFWIPTGIFASPGHIIQRIDILREFQFLVKNLTTKYSES
jgi:hypothetical protein